MFLYLTHLPRGCVMPEVSERVLKPVVDVVEAELPLPGVHDGLPDEGCVGEGRADVVRAVELLVLGDFRCNFAKVGKSSEVLVDC